MLFFTNKKSFGRLALATLIMPFAVGAAAVGAQDRGDAGAAPQALRAIDTQLSAIEGSFRKLEAAPAARTDMAAEQFEGQQAAYVAALYDSYVGNVRNAALFAKTNGKQGSANGIRVFEDLAQAHETRFRQLTERGKRLQPAGATPLTIQIPARATTLAWTPVDWIIPPARAAIALTVQNACKSPLNAAACASASAKAIIDGAAAKRQFDACWARYAKTKPGWWRATLRAGCTAALVARLA